MEPDRTLISGDGVQNKVVPNIYGTVIPVLNSEVSGQLPGSVIDEPFGGIIGLVVIEALDLIDERDCAVHLYPRNRLAANRVVIRENDTMGFTDCNSSGPVRIEIGSLQQ